MAVNIDFVTVGEQFHKYYYHLFETDRNQLTTLYNDFSCLSFEGDNVMGKDAIVKKLAGLPFRRVKHVPTLCDSQPVINVDDGKAVFVSVIGKIHVDDDPEKGFFQSFLLRPNDQSASSFYIANETFRLNLVD